MTSRHYVLPAVLFASILLAMPARAVQSSFAPSERVRAPSALTRLEHPVTLDGHVDEPAWDAVPPLPITVLQPVHGTEPSQRTEIRLAYDDRYLYASARFFDSNPDGIRMNSLTRDVYAGDDAFELLIDTYNDNQTFHMFWVLPSGTRGDSEISGDFEGSGSVNVSWNTYWAAETRVTSEGWFAEMRIPLENLRFQTQGTDARIGVTVARVLSRTNEIHAWPNIPEDQSRFKASQAADVRIDAPDRPPVIHVTPYVLGSSQRLTEVGAEQTNVLIARDRIADAGFDVKFNPWRNVTVDLTANTDFAQAEADDQQISFDRFSLFFPEKRQFFQERGGLFEFNLARGNRLFHPRRIGLDESGNPVPILGGARITGRKGPWDVGMINMQTRRTSTEPTTNFGVARFRRRVLNVRSTVGALVTSRVDERGRRSLSAGVDAVINVTGDEYVTMKIAQAQSGDDPFLATGTSQIHVNWRRRTDRGFAYSFDASRIGKNFSPDVGFVRQRDVTHLQSVLWTNMFTDDHPWLRSIQPSIVGVLRLSGADGSLEYLFIGPWVEFRTKRGGYGWIEPRFYHDRPPDGFALSPSADVPAGEYDYRDIQLYYETAGGRLLRAVIDLQAGGFYDGSRVQTTLSPVWNASRHLELSAEYEFTDIDFEDRGQSLTTHLARIRARLALNTRLSASVFAQVNSLSEVATFNGRFRYNVADGTDFWVVWNEGLNTDRSRRNGPTLPITDSRTLIVKYTHTFTY